MIAFFIVKILVEMWILILKCLLLALAFLLFANTEHVVPFTYSEISIKMVIGGI